LTRGRDGARRPDNSNMHHTIGLLILAAVVVGVIAARRSSHPEHAFESGELYSVDATGWGIRVAKVLAAEPGAVHIRLYKEHWPARPTAINARELTLGKPKDPDGFGVGHLPLRDDTFTAWGPVLIGREAVTNEELEGYQMWKEAKGGLF
jgi:hypothetical protein